jgi:Plasmid pRiA4b ORF-3-like protein
MHVFVDGSSEYGLADPELGHQDERKATLGRLLEREGERIRYTYDFGDSWEHEIVVEKVLTAEPDVRYPRRLAGKGACPPEDCGCVRVGGGMSICARCSPTQPTRSTGGWVFRRRRSSTRLASMLTRSTGRSATAMMPGRPSGGRRRGGPLADSASGDNGWFGKCSSLAAERKAMPVGPQGFRWLTRS